MVKPLPVGEYIRAQGRFKGISAETVARMVDDAAALARRLQKEEEGIC
jgi:pyruvate ferredoxin oxidoreductase beta subunit